MSEFQYNEFHKFELKISDEAKIAQNTAEKCHLSFRKNRAKCELSEIIMASVISLPVCLSRLKIRNFNRFSCNYCTIRPINRRINSSQKYWCYLLGGSVLTSVFFKCQQFNTVHCAFNPKKLKVSVLGVA